MNVRRWIAVSAVAIAAPMVAQAQSYYESTFYTFPPCCSANTGNLLAPFSPNSLIQGADGNLYGTTPLNGAQADGEVFKLVPGGGLTVLHSFCSESNCADGSAPLGGLTLASNGNFYGTTSGNFYGTPVNGYDSGTLFQLTPSGTFTTIYTFCSQQDCVDGLTPTGGLIQGSDGNLYGTTEYGGVLPDWGDDTPGDGLGTVFKLDAAGTLTTLYSFCGSSNVPGACPDGESPTGSLVEGTDKNFYGMTNSGGEYGYGSIFKISAAGDLTTLYSFCSIASSFDHCTDGSSPMAGLTLGKDGNFYGTTSFTAPDYYSNEYFQGGTVFQITPSGVLTTLYTFCGLENCQDGSTPTSTLISASDGNFYGTTSFGGYNDPSDGSSGTVFRITPSGALTTIYTFCENTTAYNCAANPSEGLFQSPDGTLYGTAGIYAAAYTGYGYYGSSTAYAITGLTGSLQTTTLTPTIAPKPLSVGQTVTLSATVASSSGTPAGNVTFSSGSEILCTAALSSGKASCSLPTGSVGPGTYPLVAQYYGSTTYNSATAVGSVALNKAPTSVVLAVNPDTITPPTTAELVVTVARSAPGATGTPTGNVSFYSGQTLLGKVTLSNGFAVMAVSVPAGLAPGTYPVTAKYGGDSTDLTATSNTVDVTVQAAK